MLLVVALALAVAIHFERGKSLHFRRLFLLPLPALEILHWHKRSSSAATAAAVRRADKSHLKHAQNISPLFHHIFLLFEAPPRRKLERLNWLALSRENGSQLSCNDRAQDIRRQLSGDCSRVQLLEWPTATPAATRSRESGGRLSAYRGANWPPPGSCSAPPVGRLRRRLAGRKAN